MGNKQDLQVFVLNTWDFSLLFHPLQVIFMKAVNCDSNSRLVVDEDDNVKSGLKGLKL